VIEIRLHGRGGQGAVTASRIISSRPFPTVIALAWKRGFLGLYLVLQYSCLKQRVLMPGNSLLNANPGQIEKSTYPASHAIGRVEFRSAQALKKRINGTGRSVLLAGSECQR
jgi:hypothetical protein